MKGEANKNLNSNNCGNIGDNIENAFSDLISQYFEEGNNAQNAVNIEQGATLDWDSVANGQLYTNNANNVNQNHGGLYTNLENIGGLNQTQNLDSIEVTGNLNNNDGILYKELGNINNGGEITNNDGIDGDIGINIGTGVEAGNGINAGTVNEVTANTGINNGTETGLGTDFKLTQGNLPAKIGFWTKVRNFFIPGLKVQYSAGQNDGNTGAWNKLQGFFSFGKLKK